MIAERFKLVLDTIKQRPAEWSQKSWHYRTEGCATTHCFAGWAQIMSGGHEEAWLAQTQAQEWLGLTKPECQYLFDIDRTIEDFEVFYLTHTMAEGPTDDLVTVLVGEL